MQVQCGVDQFAFHPGSWKHRRFAMVTNHAASTASYVPSRQALLDQGCQIVRLFSPEHGLDAVGPDGHFMAGGADPLTHLPVVSLYGEKFAPDEEDLRDVDAVLFDLPDVGCRCYTYLWTLSHVMEACELWNTQLIVLDRPNPVSGLMALAEGPMLDERHCSSFIGRWSIPLRHSCTYGELAGFWQATRTSSLELEIVPAAGWRRSMFYPEQQSSFVPTSPAITNFEACLLYSGLCLLEATNLSEGRGTPLSFRVAGAPWLNSVAVTSALNRSGIAGAVVRHVTFVPESGKYRDEGCNAIMLHVEDATVFHPVSTALKIIWQIRQMHPDHFEWAHYPTHANPTGETHLNKLLGIRDAEHLFDQQQSDFTRSIESLLDVSAWSETIGPHLLYKD